MSANNERRGEIRAALPVQLRFNLLSTLDAYIRFYSPRLDIPDALEPPSDAEARNELEVQLHRIEAKLDFVITLLADKISRKDYHYQGVVLDVSEHGLRMLTTGEIPEGTLVELGLTLPHQPHRTMDIAGQVIWLEEREREAGKAIGINFLDILPEDQDAIVHYIFQKQREEIRRQREQEY
ncbi:MAG: PilZ domain-containing protein [Proteobacteria bacterium]|nr:PilZ domain-containing protein [Pseudomonadota bacterium]